jgi:Tfp pilus assembly protein PilN
MSGGIVNLARRPFVNTRPVSRIALLLWLLSAALVALNISLYWAYFSGSTEQRARLDRVDRQVVREQAQNARLEEEVGKLDLAHQNERVLFLNDRIAERTFSWSLLFDRVAEVLPPAVRLTRLTPVGTSDKDSHRTWRRQRQAGGAEGGQIVLTIGGEAKGDEALSQFVDNLFSHPAFSEPNLSRESKDDDGTIRFDLQVVYLPGVAEEPRTGGQGAATIEELGTGPEGTEPGTEPPGAVPLVPNTPTISPPVPRAANPPGMVPASPPPPPPTGDGR